MHLAWAKVCNFRLLKDQKLAFHPSFNVVVGDNGAGKTTVLECLQVLGRGASSRGKPPSLASHGETTWSISAGLVLSGTQAIEDRIRVGWKSRAITVTINEDTVGLIELARRFPVLSLSPYSHRLIEEGPGLRRRYLDWGVFHMEQDFFPAWRRLVRILTQRNAAIRTNRRSSEIGAWDDDLAETAELITERRQQYLEKLLPLVREELSKMGETESWLLQLNPGWRSGQSYRQTLKDGLLRDLRQGFTVEGPHRAEIQLTRGQRNIKGEISRGQQKLLIAALMMAQGQLYRQSHIDCPALLVDDFAAELSERSRQCLMHSLDHYPGQKFLTALDPESVAARETDHALFHVEQGRLIRLH